MEVSFGELRRQVLRPCPLAFRSRHSEESARMVPGDRIAPRVYTTLVYRWPLDGVLRITIEGLKVYPSFGHRSIPIARSISLDDSVALMRLSR
jgi:hypothetical protein